MNRGRWMKEGELGEREGRLEDLGLKGLMNHFFALSFLSRQFRGEKPAGVSE